MFSLSPLAASNHFAPAHARSRVTPDALVWAVISGLTGATLVLAAAIAHIA
jgi:hypothetical protein